MSDVPEPSESVIELALQAGRSYAERSTAETFLNDRDWQLYNLILSGDAQLAEDGEPATFTREWVDDVWRNRRSVQYHKAELFVDVGEGVRYAGPPPAQCASVFAPR